MKKRILSVFALILFLAPGINASGRTKGFIDRSGNKIVIEIPFKRIISLYGAHSENLFSHGLDEEITGVSKNEAYPPRATKKPVFSYHDDAEKFIASHPDLILIRPMIARGYANLVLKLQRAGITVVSLQPRTVDEMYSYWKKLGMLTGKEREAGEMIKEFKAGLKRIDLFIKGIPSSSKKKVYFEAIHSKMKTFSPSSIAIFALKTAGGINIADDAQARRETNIAAYGKEHILSHAEEIDVYLAQRGAMNHAKVRRIKEEGGFSAIKAVREGKVYILDEKIVSRPTMRLLDGIYEIGRILYPSRFNDITPFMAKPVVTRARFAEMLIKTMNIRLKTPDYRHDIRKRASAEEHKYGDFKDVDYAGNGYKFIETAVYRGFFPNISKCEFHPDMPIKKGTVAYALFMNFDLPDARPVAIKDVPKTNPLFNQIQAVVGLDIIKLNKDGRFMPESSVSGREVFKYISLARDKSVH
ncbi:MAG: ABC transporter substrate-binding protein [Deltaproteobacteria bacterium]|nr:ABC transporter substrate-binding protein [Deltaproteobacteria bacterium]